MKTLVVYSSKTGNTKMIAEAIYECLPKPKEIHPVQHAPSPGGYDFIAVGGWVDKGMPDSAAAEYMRTIQGKNVGIFLTLGAYPDSPHAHESMGKAKELLAGNTLIAEFICQGKVAPDLIQWMQRLAQENPEHQHGMNSERKARLAEAAKHPDQQDCRNAKHAFARAVKQLIAKTQ